MFVLYWSFALNFVLIRFVFKSNHRYSLIHRYDVRHIKVQMNLEENEVEWNQKLAIVRWNSWQPANHA